jgi:LmbE family N-acetylglucosaminyl deacetylase
MSKLEPIEPVLVFSPHLDDAVLSCGLFLQAHPSTTVVTVLAGAPEAFHNGYNRQTTGKLYAPDAITVRREEDRRALDSLCATPVWLDLLDGDYAAHRPPVKYSEVIHDEIVRVLDEIRPKSVLSPLGLSHADHVAVSDACLEIAMHSPLAWFLYMDLPYGYFNRRVLNRRITSIMSRVQLRELDSFEGEPGVKQRAMSLYTSQYDPTRRSNRRAFDATMRGGERYWQVEGLL